MADAKLSALTSSTAVGAGDLVYSVLAAGGDRKTSVQELVNAGLTASTAAAVFAGVSLTGSTAKLFFNDTVNANLGAGMSALNPAGSQAGQIFLKGAGVAHGLLTPQFGHDNETDDYFSVAMVTADLGGARLHSMAENSTSISTVTVFETYGGSASTTDATNSFGLMSFIVGEHDGANAFKTLDVDKNIFSIHSVSSAGSLTTRLLLKGDDGELHLGNATVVALDEENDPLLARSIQMHMTKGEGIKETPHDPMGVQPVFDHESMERLGIFGPKDEEGRFLMKVQPMFNAAFGAIWQNHVDVMDIKERLGRVVAALERIESST